MGHLHGSVPCVCSAADTCKLYNKSLWLIGDHGDWTAPSVSLSVDLLLTCSPSPSCAPWEFFRANRLFRVIASVIRSLFAALRWCLVPKR